MSDMLQARRVDAAAIPTIDIAGLFAARLSERQGVAQHMRAACEHNGFFYIDNHGIPADLIDQVMAHTKSFFALPLAAKLALDKRHSKANRGYEPLGGQTLEPGAPPDLKEGFYIGPEVAADDPRAAKFNRGPNQWPPAAPAFRAVMETYRDQMTALAARLLRGLALSGYGYSVFASDKAIAQRPETIRKFVKVMREAAAMAPTDPKGVAEAMKAAFPEMDPALIEAQFQTIVPLIDNPISKAEGLGTFDKERLAKTWEWTAKAQNIPLDKLDPEKSVTRVFLN